MRKENFEAFHEIIQAVFSKDRSGWANSKICDGHYYPSGKIWL